MPQTRIGNFGETAIAASDNEIRRVTLPKGVYEGLGLGVDTATTDLSIAVGSGVQHDGILWSEDTEIIIAFTPPGAATDYTVVATHDNRSIFGGVAVEYELQGGILGDISNGVVLGWIRHPGGAVPLDADHLQDAPNIRSDLYAALLVETAPIEIVPAYPRAYLDTATLGVDITVTGLKFDIPTFTMYQHVERSAAGTPGIQSAVQHFQFYVPEAGHRPSGFDFWLNFASAPTRQLTVEVFDTNQSPVTTTSGTPITSTTGWEQKSVEVDLVDGTFEALKPWTLRLTFQVDAGGDIKIGRIRSRLWPFP